MTEDIPTRLAAIQRNRGLLPASAQIGQDVDWLLARVAFLAAERDGWQRACDTMMIDRDNIRNDLTSRLDGAEAGRDLWKDEAGRLKIQLNAVLAVISKSEREEARAALAATDAGRTTE